MRWPVKPEIASSNLVGPVLFSPSQMLPREDISTLIKLARIKGIGEAKLKALISNFNPISNIFSASYGQLSHLVGNEIVSSIKTIKNENVEPELSLLEKNEIKFMTYQDSNYPENLKVLPDTPPLLYIKGEILPEDSQAIAIIGSRRATTYGKQVTSAFVSELTSAGVTIISGLARGIDSYAHRVALENGGRTIAVLGSGIDIIYPPENRSLAAEIAENGAYISEFPLGTQPWSGNFPLRNRLIAGLSKTILVIEASMTSGIFSTVKWALDQGKEVFAVPGNITSETSKGTNSLIMDGAHPVSDVQDILEYLGIKPEISLKAKQKLEAKLSVEEAELFNFLSYDEPIPCDKLAELLEKDISKILQILLSLELKGLVKQLPGKNFIKVL